MGDTSGGTDTDTEVLRQRREIDAQIAGPTLVDRLRRTADEHGDLPALSRRVAGAGGTGAEWETLTWAQYRRAALETAAGLAEYGLRPARWWP
ncbi:hypothetical protein [Streptomonospora wellingtoniae]|uniref:Acyl-CoA synthetase n=1 Tax=Streptomonospora wellingtoniae TaxID=3075544 RepID=A0ABU2KU80_9ACTN|nr:hypothetical protein [Streptomonospora sp. DSM 45055]MDT0302808.1 hypothetical protein [Streptomonospora sp. DSM 45055]